MADNKMPTITMTPLQAAGVLSAAGWPDDQLVTGVAVGMAESSLNATAVNPKSGTSGWLQIDPHSHPDLFKKNGKPVLWEEPITNAQMGLSVYKAAGNSWSPWETYDKRTYEKYLPQAKAAVQSLHDQTILKTADQRKTYLRQLLEPVEDKVIDTAMLAGLGDEIASIGSTTGGLVKSTGAAVADTVNSGVLGALGDIGSEMAAFSDFFQALLLPSTWLRVGSGLVGVLLVVGGIVALGKEAAVSN